MSVGGFTPYRQLGSFLRRKHVWTYSVFVKNKFGLFQSLGDRIYEMRCPFVAVGLNARFIVRPPWDNHANPPSHIILTPGQPVMFRGPHFIISTMQVFGMTLV